MFTLKGKYNNCKIFTDNCDNETISQLMSLLNQESVKGEQIRIMPDTHSGKGSVIGTTMTLKNRKVIPNIVGVDIGCGMLAIKLENKGIDLPALDNIIRKYVPSGFDIHEKAIANSNIDKIIAPIDIDRALKSLGTLGSGNHFIEIDKDEDNNLWLVIHTGSRHLGIEVCNYYQDLAYEKLVAKNKGGSLAELSKDLIAKLKAEGKDKEISKELKKLKDDYNSIHMDIPHALAYLENEDFDDYIHDMRLAQEHALINRETIAKQIMEHANLKETERFQTIHNYIDCDNLILRKGSISARMGEKVIIPMNMRDGSLICVGKGNPDWNFSAPHGAGRLMSRSKAKENISMDDYKKSMEGIYSTSICQSTIDESAFAYKPMQEIMENVKDTVEIVNIIKPIYNFKASE